jgi:hypothetical protein
VFDDLGVLTSRGVEHADAVRLRMSHQSRVPDPFRSNQFNFGWIAGERVRYGYARLLTV